MIRYTTGDGAIARWLQDFFFLLLARVLDAWVCIGFPLGYPNLVSFGSFS